MEHSATESERNLAPRRSACPHKFPGRTTLRTLTRAAAFMVAALTGGTAYADAPDFQFRSLDGSIISLNDFRGAPVLLINTAMQDGFAVQLAGVKELRRAYSSDDLTIILTPRDDIRSGTVSPRAVAHFYRDLHRVEMPITYPVRVGPVKAGPGKVSPVKVSPVQAGPVQASGPRTHPFYEWLSTEIGAPPRWNFNKILLNAEGGIEQVFGAEVWPTDRRITSILDQRIEAARSSRSKQLVPDSKETTRLVAIGGDPVPRVADVDDAVLASPQNAGVTEVTYGEEIVGEIASAEMWPPQPMPRPETAVEMAKLRAEALAAAEVRNAVPWPPRPRPRPTD